MSGFHVSSMEELEKVLAKGDSKIAPESASKRGRPSAALSVVKEANAAPAQDSKAAEPKKARHRSHRAWSTDLTLKTLGSLGFPEPVLEFKFHPKRQWKFDIAWPNYKVALEVEGGIFKMRDEGGNLRQGAHGSVTGILRDIEKYNAAAALGWVVLRALPKWMPGLSMDPQLTNHLERIFKLTTAA